MGRNLNRIRNQIGLARWELSEMTGISLSLIESLEEETVSAVSVRDAVALADALGISVQQLFK